MLKRQQNEEDSTISIPLETHRKLATAVSCCTKPVSPGQNLDRTQTELTIVDPMSQCPCFVASKSTVKENQSLTLANRQR